MRTSIALFVLVYGAFYVSMVTGGAAATVWFWIPLVAESAASKVGSYVVALRPLM